jgi:proline dehydrogenase
VSPDGAAAGDFEAEVQRAGRTLSDAFPSPMRHPMRAIDERAMDLAASDMELRAALFRFVDVVPACHSLDDLARHLAGFVDELPDRPGPLDAAMRMADSKTGRRALGAASAAGVKHMAHRFIVGEAPKDALRVLRGLWKAGIASSVDLLGEATVTTAEADRYAARCEQALQTLAGAYAGWPGQPALESDGAGPLPRANLSVKVSALTPLLRPDAPELGKRDAAPRLRALLRSARELGAHLHIDMESLDSREAVFELILELLAEDEFRDGPSAGVVLQAYLRDSPVQLDRLVAWARSVERASPLTVRLVKGAYWDHEVIEARQHGWPAPVFEDKPACDRNFESLTATMLDARPDIRVAIASHNLRSVAHAIAAAQKVPGTVRAPHAQKVPGTVRAPDVEFQVLRGLGDDLAHALAATGERVRAYCPVGDLVAGMAYLVRRLLENTANESFLSDAAKGVPIEELLAAP